MILLFNLTSFKSQTANQLFVSRSKSRESKSISGRGPNCITQSKSTSQQVVKKCCSHKMIECSRPSSFNHAMIISIQVFIIFVEILPEKTENLFGRSLLKCLASLFCVFQTKHKSSTKNQDRPPISSRDNRRSL